MNMILPPVLRFLIAGLLKREFILTPAGKPILDIQGGNLLYAASGCAIWEPGIGLLGRVGENYPHDWLDTAARMGFDSRGIHISPDVLDQRSFFAYTDLDTAHLDNPVSHFARLGLPFPRSLLGFSNQPTPPDSRTTPGPFTIRLSDLPSDYLDAAAAHLCPIDYLSHSLLPPALRKGNINTITVDPAASYMNPAFWNVIPGIIKGLSAFLPSEEKLTALFEGRTTDLWAMAEELASHGCDIIVINRGSRGQLLFDHSTNTRYTIPIYPGRVIDPTGSVDAFCGGFLAGLHSTYSSLEGVLTGNISASLANEGSGPFYPLDALPGLAKARLEALRGSVHKV
jgi:hypothetical protein